MKTFFYGLLLACNVSAALAQRYVIVGGGFSMMHFASSDLALFEQTYNQVNINFGQTALLRGFDLGIGLSGEISYRHMGKWSKALSLGYQAHSATDIAAFANGDERNLKLTATHFYVQPSWGIIKKNLFLDGVLTLFVQREFELQSRLIGSDQPNPLTGDYSGQTDFAADLGVAFGAFSGPILLTFKISYPIYKSGGTNIFTDPSPTKAAQQLDAFPDDFINYVNLQPYQGVSSKIDGFKVAITLNFALRLSPLEAER